ncbi:MAG: metalloprotease [Bacteroidetes bacterium GWF2_43_63]|nr:MAG: metalloprotease [Bacteroidetes bacterium GWE2_42_42]OFY54271.1 MAG: metalloprotease [Bacteroidetes bacterium GWF2_43_63]HBG69334.1 metalloprotease [Bacteroidales bacterium]HCB60387.1 metalloprotease [Bacteroidales bacterium]HCY23626.1 metalloprotease [Bacteroidales bacterium]
MKWQGRQGSSNVEDRRGKSKGLLGGGIGTIVVVIIIYLLGGDPSGIIQNATQNPTQSSEEYKPSAKEQELADFSSVVLKETEETWTKLFSENGKTYRLPKLVLFTDAVQSGCGSASANSGPFYCPADEKVYIDLSFFEELGTRFGAPGDFAMAYVIAHEVGHHIQLLLGINEKYESYRDRLSETEFNKMTVKLELQADYFAGVWAHYAERMNLLEEGDLEEALNAASAIGDDRLQKKSQGHVNPDTFTHGTSEQRSRWFLKGFRSGNMNGGDTFAASSL